MSLVLLHCNIDAHSKDWQITGVSKDISEHIIDIFKLQHKTHPNNDETDFIIRKVKLSMKPFGYYNAKVSLNQKTHTIVISKGPATHVTGIEIIDKDSGMPTEKFNHFLGKIFTTTLFSDLKEEILIDARSKGYLRAKMNDSRAVVDPINNTATIRIQISKGDKYHVSEIALSPATYFTHVLTPYLSLKPGEIFSREKVSQLQLNLNSSGLFKSSYVTPIFDDKNNTTKIIINNTSQPKLLYTFGAGVDSRSGLSITSQQIAIINRYAHKIFSEIGIADKLLKGSLTYHIPSEKYRYSFTELGFSAEYFTEVPAPDENEVDFFARYSRSWQYIDALAELNYVFKRSRYDKKADYQDQLIPGGVLRIRPPFLQALKPSIKIKSTMSKRGILSDNTFFQTRGTLSLTPNIGPFILSSQLTVGRTFHDKPLDKIWLYRTGGSYSLRGFTYDSIGPGDHLLLLRNGLFYKFMSSFSMGPIYDAGDTSDSFRLYYKSYGFAANWHSPVGNMQAFIARPTNKVQYHIGISLHS